MIKKTLLIIIGLILISRITVPAQDFKFGILAGLVVANAHITNKPNGNEDSQIFYPMVTQNVNGYIGYKSHGFWGLSIEPGYIQKGGKIDDRTIDIQLNYIQLPISTDLYISDKFFVSVGPEFSYLINEKAKSKDNSNDITGWCERKFELSGFIGINYNIVDKLDIGLRYNHGLTYTSKITWINELGEGFQESNIYNQYLQFIVRFKI